ncbi:estradiol 17-beta-dehydrogenase 11-like isoform X3 [Lepidochelys kempii]|uniref:estradiol 17-beta-dehydrogenase 11-like isoform X3 n=1 Tax=Lepidochelys kempii TaxID=8472 RepID=UPI003C703113
MAPRKQPPGPCRAAPWHMRGSTHCPRGSRPMRAAEPALRDEAACGASLAAPVPRGHKELAAASWSCAELGQHGIEETAAECRRLGAAAHAFVVDCSKREEIYSAAEKVKKDIGDVNILVNNAGVITTADLLSTQDQQIQKMFEVNTLAHYWTTKAFLPAMMKNNHGHIVTVASVAGHLVASFMVTYCSSKFAAVGFHKALTQELSALGKDGIKTSCLCPVFINTGFVKNPSIRLMKVLEPEKVVNKLLEGILTNQKIIFVPSFLKICLIMEKKTLILLQWNQISKRKYVRLLSHLNDK